MKKLLLIILIMLVSTPVFAEPGEFYIDENGYTVCDDSESQAYFQELVKQYQEKYYGKAHSAKDYNREVLLPLYIFEEEQQLKGYCGFKNL